MKYILKINFTHFFSLFYTLENFTGQAWLTLYFYWTAAVCIDAVDPSRPSPASCQLRLFLHCSPSLRRDGIFSS